MLVNTFGLKKPFAFVLFLGILTSLQAGGLSAVYEQSSGERTTTDNVNLVDADGNAIIYLWGDLKSFTNNHELTINGTMDGDPVVVGVAMGGISDATITNNGKIIAIGSGEETAVGVWVDPLSETTIVNNGEIVGQFSIFAYDSKNDFTINNMENGVLDGVLHAKGATLNNSGIIHLGTNIDIFGTNYLPMVSRYTQGATGTLGIELNLANDGSVTSYSKLYVTNSISLADGATIHVDVIGSNAGASAFLNSDATLYDVLKVSEAAIDVDMSKLNVTDSSALLDFEALLSDGNRSLGLHVIENSISEVVDVGTPPESTTTNDTVDTSTPPKPEITNDTVDTNIPSGSLAAILDTLKNTNVEAGQFRNYLITLPTSKAVAKALNQVKPKNTLNSQNVSYQITNAMSHVVQSRQASVRGLNSGDVAFADKNIWVKPFGGHTSQDDVNGIDGFSASTYGFGMGIDGEYKHGSHVGLALFYTKADVDTNNVAQSSQLDVFNLVAYGSNPIIDNKTNLFYQLSYGLQKTDTKRAVSGVGVATADYTSKVFFAQLKAIKEIQLHENLQAKPALVGSYTHFRSPSYSESGIGGLNLSVNKFNSDAFVLGLGSDFIYSLDKTSKLSANIGLSYDFSNSAQALTSSFQGGGGVFSTEGIDNGSIIYKVGLGYVKKVRENLFLDFKYDFEGRGGDLQNHVISSRVSYKF